MGRGHLSIELRQHVRMLLLLRSSVMANPHYHGIWASCMDVLCYALERRSRDFADHPGRTFVGFNLPMVDPGVRPHSSPCVQGWVSPHCRLVDLSLTADYGRMTQYPSS